MSIYSLVRMDDESVNNQVHTNKVYEKAIVQLL